MTSQEVRQIVELQIAGDWDHKNWHGRDVRRCVVTPVKKPYKVDWSDEDVELWLVLEEQPDNKAGYKIVFDEVEGDLGLATPGFDKRDVCFGFYASFFDALDSM
jgi:hypothetical protein